MAKNIFTKIPVWGDAVVGNLATGEPEFITSESFDPTALSASAYEMIGAVGGRFGRDVLIVWKHNALKKWCERIEYKLTGYTLDGAEHTGVLSIVLNSGTSAPVAYTVTYTASDKAGLVAALNAFFAATAALTAQKWFARTDEGDGEIYIGCDFEFSRQMANTGKSGFTLTTAILPDVAWVNYMPRRNGFFGSDGAVCNLPRALTYFRGDISANSYNPAGDVTSVKLSYPICLPAYLGTSKYQSDHCAFLRSVYGEGEAGWIRFMKSLMPVTPTDFGVMGVRDGEERTAFLAAKKFTLSDGVARDICPAATYAKTSPDSTVVTDWFLPTAEHLASILGPVQYGTSANRDADALNRSLQLMGGDDVSNARSFWLCIRHYTTVWIATGGSGIFAGDYMYTSQRSLPVSLYRLPKAI